MAASRKGRPGRHNVLLVTGGQHHDYAGGERILREALEGSGRFSVATAHMGEGGVPELASLPGGRFAAVILYAQGGQECPREQEEGLAKFVEAGGGLLGLHSASTMFSKSRRFAKLLGSRFAGHAEGTFDFRVQFDAALRTAGHPLAARCDDFIVHDEHYVLEMVSDAEVFASSMCLGKAQPMGYLRRQGRGTVAYLANGHDARTLGQAHFQRLLLRCARVVCGESLEVAPRSIRAGILGYGGAFNMGKAHATAINGQFGMATVAVCDLDPRRTEQAKVELGADLRTYQRMEDLIGDDEVNLVVVILPHHLHAPACIAASRAGKHVVTEKPFCITLEQADAMIRAARRAGTMLSCFHNRRWDGDFLTILNLVRSGAIGEVFHLDASTAGYGMPRSWWRSDKKASGGVMYDWGAHYMDWTLNLMPKRIASVSGSMQKRYWRQSDNEDFAQAFIRFQDGTTATLEQGNLAAVKRQGWRILGTRGGITNAGAGQPVTLVQHAAAERRESVIQPPQGQWANYYQNVANHLLIGEPLIVTPQQARRAIGVIRLAELSSRQGGAPLELPGEDTFEPRYLQPL